MRGAVSCNIFFVFRIADWFIKIAKNVENDEKSIKKNRKLRENCEKPEIRFSKLRNPPALGQDPTVVANKPPPPFCVQLLQAAAARFRT